VERKAKEYFFKVKENVAYVQPAVHRPGKHKETEIETGRFAFLSNVFLRFSVLD